MVAQLKRTEPLYWRLVYADDVRLDEPLTCGSILESWSGAVALHIVRSINDFVLCEIDLRGGYRPIWYRVRSAGAQLSMSKQTFDLGGGYTIPQAISATREQARTDAIIFGRAKCSALDQDLTTMVAKKSIEVSNLFAFTQGRIIECPKKLIDQAQIERLLTEPLKDRQLYFM